MRWSRHVVALLLVCGAIDRAGAQTRVITGRVADAVTADGLSGVRLTLRGAPTSVLTKQDGTFTIGAPPGDVSLTTQVIGYKKREVRVPNSSSAAPPH